MDMPYVNIELKYEPGRDKASTQLPITTSPARNGKRPYKTDHQSYIITQTEPPIVLREEKTKDSTFQKLSQVIQKIDWEIHIDIVDFAVIKNEVQSSGLVC